VVRTPWVMILDVEVSNQTNLKGPKGVVQASDVVPSVDQHRCAERLLGDAEALDEGQRVGAQLVQQVVDE
jgi:hypothetical protein